MLFDSRLTCVQCGPVLHDHATHLVFTLYMLYYQSRRFRWCHTASMQPPTPSLPNRKKRGLPLPRTQAMGGRWANQEEEKEEMGEQGGRGRGMAKEIRNRIMHDLFGDQSDEEEEQHPDGGDEVTSVNRNDHGRGGGESHHHRRRRLPAPATTDYAYKSNNGDHGHHDHQLEEGTGESQWSGGITGLREGGSHHVELGYQKMRGNKKAMSNEKEGYDQRIVTSRTRFVANADEEHKDEDAQTRKSGSTKDDKAHEVVREVFGDSDEDELALYGGQDDTEDVNRSPIEDEGHGRNYLQSEGIVPDKDKCYESDANFEHELKERPIGSPLNLLVSSRQPPGRPDRMHVIKTSNLLGIDPKPFDPETYVEEDSFITDESGGTKRIRLRDNVIRWRQVKNADGTVYPESNARLVKWKDGTMQLLIGDKALDVSVNESHGHSHLFLKTKEGVLQSQGRLLQNMIVMPPSLSSRSHRSLTALDSQNNNTVKVQTGNDTRDPERVKQERERAEEEIIRANSVERKREKVNRKRTQPHREKQQLTPGFMEYALDEDEAHCFKYNSSGRLPQTGFEHDLEIEAPVERHLVNAKKVHEYSESEKEDLEYETEIEDTVYSPTHGRENELDGKDGYDKDPQEAIGVASMPYEETEEQERRARKGKAIVSGEEFAPKKQPFNRGKAVVFDSDDE